MTYATHGIEVGATWTPSRASLGGNWLGVIGTWIGDVFRRWRERRVQSRAIRHLRALDDRILKDIGLHRSQIVSAVVQGSPNADSREQHIYSAADVAVISAINSKQ